MVYKKKTDSASLRLYKRRAFSRESVRDMIWVTTGIHVFVTL